MQGDSCWKAERCHWHGGALSLRRPPLTGPAGNTFKESSVCSHLVEMCKTPTECSRECAQRSKGARSTIKKTGGLWLISGNTETLYRDGGQSAVSRPSLHLLLKIHTHTHAEKLSELLLLLLLLFINSPTAHILFEFQAVRMKKNKKHLRWNPALRGNSSKKLLPISTIEITPQYAIVLSAHSWKPLVFLWGKGGLFSR